MSTTNSVGATLRSLIISAWGHVVDAAKGDNSRLAFMLDSNGELKYNALEWDRPYGYPDVLIPSILDRVWIALCGDHDDPTSTKPGDKKLAAEFGELGKAAFAYAEARKAEQDAGSSRYAWYHAAAEGFAQTGELARAVLATVPDARIFQAPVPMGVDPETGNARTRTGTFVTLPEMGERTGGVSRVPLI